jgi:hypothetical protein
MNRQWLIVGLIACAVIATACRDSIDASEAEQRGTRSGWRNVEELQRLSHTPRACEADPDCPVGSHCDDATGACAWACIADSECGAGRRCDLYGMCVAASAGTVTTSAADNTPACQLVPATERRSALLALFEAAQDGEFIPCDGDEACPCGSYCSDDAVCAVECITDTPPAELRCDAGLSCTPLGRCAPVASDPGPPLQLTIALSEVVTRANTATAPVVVPLTVTVAATSFAVLAPTNPAVVKLTIAETRAHQQGRVDRPPALAPRVKCAAADPLSSECVINGGWTFNVASGQLRSQPKTIWVEIPQTTTAQRWLLEARSEWAADPARDVIQAVPVIIPATDPGRYKGTLLIDNDGAANPANAFVELPVEALVTATHIALFEPTRAVLPDGHAVLSRDAAKATMLGWLSAGTARYDVALKVEETEYDPTTGHLGVAVSLATGTGVGATTMGLTLHWTGSAPAPTCPCQAGFYCNAAMAVCLPGSGPPSGAGIVPAASAIPSSMLPSATLAAWTPPLATVAASAPTLLSGAGTTGIERAYCFQSINQPSPAQFGIGPLPQPVSADLSCKQGGAAPLAYAQPTFGFADLDREYVPGTGGGAAFDLFEACLAQLGAQPSGSATAANLLGARSCVSLGRFFLAINANTISGVGRPLTDSGQRLVSQLLRQWLGVNAYVASSAIQTRQYDDALSISSAPAHERLGSTLELIDRGLRVLLDPRVRPQYATGADLIPVTATPDYRIAARPVARWTFNQRTSPALDVEGGVALATPGADLSSSDLLGRGAPGTTCATSQPVVLGDRRFTIVANLTGVAIDGTRILFEKRGPGGDRLWLEATTTSGGFQTRLALKDSRGGVAAFAPVGNGLIAVVVDDLVYRLYRAQDGLAVLQAGPTHIVSGGPRWGAPGPVHLACDAPSPARSCTSWDRNAPGDGLDTQIRPAYVEVALEWVRSCSTRPPSLSPRCEGTAPEQAPCTELANARRTQLLQSLAPNLPATRLNALSVQGELAELASGTEVFDDHTTTWTQYRCNTRIANEPVAASAVKPVCGTTRWDEVALWSRPVPFDEFSAMAARYGWARTNETVPAKPVFPGNEQAAALPVHLVEAASADLDLLSEYIEAERGAMYEECYLGGASPARERVTRRAGENLRLVALVEGEAAHLAELPQVSTAPWYPRYRAAHRLLAGRRAKAIKALQLATECKNPLGISEDDLPLFVGEEVGPTAKFFASSRFLTAKAREEIGLAQTKLGSAQAKYIEQRQTAYQLNQARESKTLRESKLRTDYESQLMRFCGKPAGSQQLLDGFLAGTLTPGNCFIKIELPACAQVATTPLASAPVSCLRGSIGSRLLAIKSAEIDMQNAYNNLVRKTEQYDGDMSHCGRRQESLFEDELILDEHNEHMQRLRRESLVVGGVFGGLQAFTQLASGNVPDGFSTLLGVVGDVMSGHLEELVQQEQASFEAVMRARSHRLEVAECYHNVDNEKFAIDAARDVIKRAAHDVASAAFQLDSDNNALIGLVDEAAGQLAVEQGIDSTPPHLHYWLHAEISEYQRHLEYARRLTYLALRAFEYEAQQSIGHRGNALTARRPDALLAVVTAIEQRNVPRQGQGGLVIGARPLVLSLRDEILRIPDLTSGPRLPGQAPLSPEQAFKQFLASESSKIIDNTGRFIGRGIRFSLRPAAWTETSCAERIWRITPSLQIDNPPTQHLMVLRQDNAFASQDCDAAFGEVLVRRAESSVNLLVGDTAAFAASSAFTEMNIDGPLGLDHESLRARPEGDITGLAGRGLYGNYILLFPPLTWTDAQIAKVKDVLLRFDIVELTHVR